MKHFAFQRVMVLSNFPRHIHSQKKNFVLLITVFIYFVSLLFEWLRYKHFPFGPFTTFTFFRTHIWIWILCATDFIQWFSIQCNSICVLRLEKRFLYSSTLCSWSKIMSFVVLSVYCAHQTLWPNNETITIKNRLIWVGLWETWRKKCMFTIFWPWRRHTILCGWTFSINELKKKRSLLFNLAQTTYISSTYSQSLNFVE